MLWSVLQHELYSELKSYGQLYMYECRCNFSVCPKLVLLWSVSTWIYAKLNIHAKLKFYGQLTLKPMRNSKFMLKLLHIYGMMHCAQTTCTGGTGTGGSNLWYKMADFLQPDADFYCLHRASITLNLKWVKGRYSSTEYWLLCCISVVYNSLC